MDSVKCDRCPLVGPVELLLGHQLCLVCMYDARIALKDFVDAGRKIKSFIGRASHGSRFEQAKELCIKHGFVNSTMLAEVTGQDRAVTGNYLHKKAQHNRLLYCGQGIFKLPPIGVENDDAGTRDSESEESSNAG